MMSFLKKMIYKNIVITEYSGITVDREIYEKVFLEAKDKLLEISTCHWVLCLEPVIFGVWLKKGEPPFDPDDQDLKMIIRDPEKTLAKVKLKVFSKMEEEEGSLYLMKYEEGNIYHTNFAEARFLFSRYYRKPGHSFKKFKALVTAYSYPRRVRIISFKEGGHFNIFPMDLLAPIPGSNKFVFGLRHTNRTLAKIIETGKIVVSEVSFEHKDEIYKLGKHHSTSPPSLDLLPFTTSPSKMFGFPVPAWASSYKEIRIVKTINLGSHMLMWGETAQEEKIKEPSPGFYHIHFLLFLHQERKGRHYKLV